MVVQRTVCYDLMCVKTKELGLKKKIMAFKTLASDSEGNITVDRRQVLKVWENYVTKLCDQANRPEIVEAETEEEMDPDEKGPYIMHSEVEKVIMEMMDKKAPGDDVSGYVLILLGEDGLRIMAQLINNIYKTGESLKDFIEVIMIALKKKPKLQNATAIT
jgi:hypothetical protein